MARVGWGVACSQSDSLYLSGPLEGLSKTNNRAEAAAALFAFRLLVMFPIHLVIDSKNMADAISKLFLTAASHVVPTLPKWDNMDITFIPSLPYYVHGMSTELRRQSSMFTPMSGDFLTSRKAELRKQSVL